MSAEAEFPPSLDAAILALQADLPVVAKTRTADVQMQSGRSYKYDYADLDDVSEALFPRLAALGLIWVTKPTLMPDGKTFVLNYKLKHVPSGEVEEGSWPLPTNGASQALGSATTFARRYCLCAVTGLVPKGDDDDGAAAGRPPSTAQRQRRQAGRPAAAENTAQRARPPGPPLPGEDGHGQPAGNGRITDPQVRKILAIFGDHGIKEKAERLDVCSRVVGRTLSSALDMSVADASKVIDTLEGVKAGQFDEWLVQLVQRAEGHAAAPPADDGVPEPPPGVGLSREEQEAIYNGGELPLPTS